MRIVIDTSVWLTLAGDYRNLPLLQKLAGLIDEGEVSLLLADLIHDEFTRNKERVIRQASARQTELFKRVRGAVQQFGEADKDEVLRKILDVEHKIATNGEAVNEVMAEVEELMKAADTVTPSVVARSRATNRGIEKIAPFVAGKNATADAVILETYLEALEEEEDPMVHYVFLSMNTTEFSDPAGDKRNPHPHLALHFE